MRLSQKYADHAAELDATVNYITGDAGAPSDAAERLGISADEVTAIGVLRNTHQEAYAAYINPNTHNAIAVQAIKIADEKAFAVILPLRQRLKYGVAELTPEDYANLGIHEDKKTRTPSEVPTDAPRPVLVNSAPRTLTFEATEQTEEGANRSALPKNCRVAREIVVLPQGAAEPAEGDFHPIDSVGRSRFMLMFQPSEAGMNVYVRLAYENTAGKGPFSLPVKAVII